MSAYAAPIRDPMDDLRKIKTDKGRKGWLQRYLGPRTDDKDELDRRALFCSRVREEKLWPK